MARIATSRRPAARSCSPARCCTKPCRSVVDSASPCSAFFAKWPPPRPPAPSVAHEDTPRLLTGLERRAHAPDTSLYAKCIHTLRVRSSNHPLQVLLPQDCFDHATPRFERRLLLGRRSL